MGKVFRCSKTYYATFGAKARCELMEHHKGGCAPLVARKPALAQEHSATSREAAAKIEPTRNEKRAVVLRAIELHGGLTDEQVAELTGMDPNTARPRRIELIAEKLVRDSGRTRVTRSGRKAVVWEKVPPYTGTAAAATLPLMTAEGGN